jgi:hypothetical protein
MTVEQILTAQALYDACAAFVNKVYTGRACSTESYAQMTAAMEKTLASGLLNACL